MIHNPEVTDPDLPVAPIPTPAPPPDTFDDLVAMEDGAAAAPVAPHGDSAPTGTRLVVKRNGAETDESFPIFSPATIGRFDPTVGPIDVDLGPLPEGQYVSRKHARLTQEDGTWTVTDLGSSNGTFVLRNGDFERAESAELADGDEFALGNARFVLKLT